jgi:hypothetical protein
LLEIFSHGAVKIVNSEESVEEGRVRRRRRRRRRSEKGKDSPIERVVR